MYDFKKYIMSWQKNNLTSTNYNYAYSLKMLCDYFIVNIINKYLSVYVPKQSFNHLSSLM